MRGCEAAVRYAPAGVFANEETASQSPAARPERKRYNFGMLIDIPLRGIWGYDVPFKIEKYIFIIQSLCAFSIELKRIYLLSPHFFFLTFMKRLSDAQKLSHTVGRICSAVSALEKVLGAPIIILEQETRTLWFEFFQNQSKSAWVGSNDGNQTFGPLFTLDTASVRRRQAQPNIIASLCGNLCLMQLETRLMRDVSVNQNIKKLRAVKPKQCAKGC